MNWLAHVYLSEPDPAFRIGNLLPDLVPRGVIAAVPEQFQRGIDQHRAIDRFTDSHPVVGRSIERLDPPFRRYGGILIDVFYDHFLARNWPAYSPQSLPVFTRTFYASFDRFRDQVPTQAFLLLEKMKAEDWLCSYAELSGISTALRRIGARLLRPIDLSESLSVLQKHRRALQVDFEEFFPELRARFLPAKH